LLPKRTKTEVEEQQNRIPVCLWERKGLKSKMWSNKAQQWLKESASI
jgi:hypothetical protein